MALKQVSKPTPAAPVNGGIVLGEDDDLNFGALPPEFVDYEEVRVEGDFIGKSINAGAHVKKPGSIWLKHVGASFVGQLLGMVKPEAFDRPCLVWRINGERYISPTWFDILDQCLNFLPDLRPAPNTPEGVLPWAEDPQWVRVIYKGEQPIRNGSQSKQIFECVHLRPRGWKARQPQVNQEQLRDQLAEESQLPTEAPPPSDEDEIPY